MPTMFETMARGAAWGSQLNVMGSAFTHHNYEADTDESVSGVFYEMSTEVDTDDNGTFVVRMAELELLPADLTSVDTRNTITDLAGDIWDVDGVEERSPFIVYTLKNTPRRHYGNYSVEGG